MILRVFIFLCGLSTVLAQVQQLGMNIEGFAFGCMINGTCNMDTIVYPLVKLGGKDGAGQMQHFYNDDQMRVFRLPVSWQYLVKNDLATNILDKTNFAKYDALMRVCLATGADCVIDVHNYARWDDMIIGQGGPTNAQFASLWSQLATKYKDEPKVVFGLMNEPHDLNIVMWADTVQAAVTAIRQAGATTQMILIPGTNFTCAVTFISTGSLSALMGVVNLDNSTTNLVFDVHQYLDFDNSGTHDTCTLNNTVGFIELAKELRAKNRKAVIGETGSGGTDSCLQYFCEQNTAINANGDVFIMFIGWAAGSFSSSYVLSMTPTQASNGKWTDNQLTSQCVIGPWLVNNPSASSAYSVALTSTPTNKVATDPPKKSESGQRTFGSGRVWGFDGAGVLAVGWVSVWAVLLGASAWL